MLHRSPSCRSTQAAAHLGNLAHRDSGRVTPCTDCCHAHQVVLGPNALSWLRVCMSELACEIPVPAAGGAALAGGETCWTKQLQNASRNRSSVLTAAFHRTITRCAPAVAPRASPQQQLIMSGQVPTPSLNSQACHPRPRFEPASGSRLLGVCLGLSSCRSLMCPCAFRQRSRRRLSKPRYALCPSACTVCSLGISEPACCACRLLSMQHVARSRTTWPSSRTFSSSCRQPGTRSKQAETSTWPHWRGASVTYSCR